MAQYIIKGGDTLSKIAQQFGYGSDYMSIAKANNIANPNMIQAGATLNIPDRAAPGQVPASAPAPVQSQPQPQVQLGGGVPPVDMSKYVGWNDQAAIQADWANNWQSKGGGTTGSGSAVPTVSAPAIPNFQGIYDTAIKTATDTYAPQITAAQAEQDTIQKEIDARTAARNVALGKINDNPYYSEATRVGRAAKIDQAYNNDVQAITGRLSVAQNKVINAQNQADKAKADAQVKINIASNQYSIENTQYQQQLQQINSLLTAGMFNNASSGDIAQIATSTGMSTSMVQSIIDASKKSKEVKPTLSTIDDGTSQYVVAFDDKGNIINKQVIGKSKPATTGGTTNSTMDTQKLYDKYDTQVQKILEEVDTMNQGGDKDYADKQLADWEQEAAVTRVMALLGVDRNVAFDIVSKAFDAGGYSAWKG